MPSENRGRPRTEQLLAHRIVEVAEELDGHAIAKLGLVIKLPASQQVRFHRPIGASDGERRPYLIGHGTEETKTVAAARRKGVGSHRADEPAVSQMPQAKRA